MRLPSFIAILFFSLAAALGSRGIARADLADERTSEFLTALQHNDFDTAEVLCSPLMRSGMPQVKAAWQGETRAFGELESFQIADRRTFNRMQVRVATLNFAHPSGLAAQVAVDDLGNISGLYFVPAPGSPGAAAAASPELQKVADDRVNEMLTGMHDEKFVSAETHFDSAMKAALGPNALEQAWKQRTALLGALTAWRVVGRAEVGGNLVRIVNVDFANAPSAFALQVAVSPSGEIGGLYFVAAQTESSAR